MGKSACRSVLWVETGDERGLVDYLDVGARSEFAQILPFKLRNVADLAAHYDALMAFVTQEPSGTYMNQNGRTCIFHVRVKRY